MASKKGMALLIVLNSLPVEQLSSELVSKHIDQMKYGGNMDGLAKLNPKNLERVETRFTNEEHESFIQEMMKHEEDFKNNLFKKDMAEDEAKNIRYASIIETVNKYSEISKQRKEQ